MPDDVAHTPDPPSTDEAPSAEGTPDAFVRADAAGVALAGVVARFESLLTALEARPGTEGPLEACAALIESDEGQVLTVGADEQLVLDLLSESPSLAGRLLWKVEAVMDRLAVDFGRRLGVPHTDLRPQLLASCVVAALNAALNSWLSSPSGPTLDELARRALADLAGGLR